MERPFGMSRWGIGQLMASDGAGALKAYCANASAQSCCRGDWRRSGRQIETILAGQKETMGSREREEMASLRDQKSHNEYMKGKVGSRGGRVSSVACVFHPYLLPAKPSQRSWIIFSFEAIHVFWNLDSPHLHQVPPKLQLQRVLEGLDDQLTWQPSFDRGRYKHLRNLLIWYEYECVVLSYVCQNVLVFLENVCS